MLARKLSIEELLVIGNDAAIKGVLCSSRFMELFKANASKLPSLEFIVCFDKDENAQADLSSPGLKQLDFKDLANRPATGDLFQPKEEDLAAIVYTSGTTGVPKGVMLTHGNIASNVAAGLQFIDLGPHDNMISVLPLHHTFECTCGFLAPLAAGGRVTYVESLKSYQLIAAMKETGMTIMLAVPLLYRLFFDGILREVEEKGPVFKFLFSTLYWISKFFIVVIGFNLGSKLFGSLHRKLGGKLRFWVSGGAAIDPELLKNYEVLGITIIQGYGLTESSPILSACDLKHNRIGSAGRALPGVEVKIFDPDGRGVGEIIARGPNIMQGYYKRKDFTAEVIKNGWLHTGDVGYLDDDGYLYITGRQKDVIVTGAGVNVYPEEIEFVLNKIPFIKESCVFGQKMREGLRQGMEQVQVVIVPNYEYFETFAAQQGLTMDGDLIKKTINREIAEFNSHIADYKRIEKVMISDADLPKTTTRKIKRFIVKNEWGGI